MMKSVGSFATVLALRQVREALKIAIELQRADNPALST